MPPRKTKRRTEPTGAHPVTGFRLPPTTLGRLDRIADALGTSRTEAINVAAYFALERLGLLREDVAAAIDSLARIHGDEGHLMAVLNQYEADPDDPDVFTAYVAITADGERELEDWTGFVVPMVTATKARALIVYGRHDPTEVTFRFGIVKNPNPGNAFVVEIKNLPELVLAPTGTNELEVRRELRDNIALARKLFNATDNPESEEVPSDD